MSRKTLIKTILILLLAPVLASVLIGLVGGMGLASVFLLLVQVGDRADEKTDQLIFLNESSAEIAFVELEQDANRQTFSLGNKNKITIEWENWPCELTISDSEGDEVGRLTIKEDPQEDFSRDEWYVIAQDGPDGVVLTLSHSKDLEKIRKWGEETSGLDLSDGTIRTFIYRHGSFGDGDTILVMSFTPEQGGALEQAMAETKGWHLFSTHELVNKIFFTDNSYCHDRSGENYLPTVDNGWYFFRDMYNVQHGETDENQWVVEGRTRLPGNFDAGIYDRDTHTLYLFEFDS